MTITQQINPITGEWNLVTQGAGVGDVTGPINSGDNEIVRFSGVTGKLIQRSVVTISDTGVLNGVSSMSLSTPLNVASGGSGRNTAIAFSVLCGGTTTTTPHQSVAGLGVLGQALTSNGPGVLPTFQTGGAGGPAFSDSLFRIQDNGDVTKQLALEVAAITTGTTRTITVPDSDLNLTPTTGSFQGSAQALTDISGAAVTNSNFLVGNGTNWVAETGAVARTSLGLGTIATQNSNAVTITGGSITAITDLLVTDGGTGRSLATAFGVICGGTTNTSPHQSIAGLGVLGQVLTSNGGGVLPSFQANPAVFSDSLFRIQDNGDATKQLALEVAAITTGTTRTITVPDLNLDLTPTTGSFQGSAQALTDISGLAVTNNNFIVGNGTNWVAENDAVARLSLGLGTIATQNSNTVAITGGDINGTSIGSTTQASGSFNFIILDAITGSFANSRQEFHQAGVQTLNATLTQIASIALPVNTMVTLEARINGFISTFADCIGGRVFYTARRAAGGAIEVSSPIVDIQEDSAGALLIDADVSGNNVRLLVQGIAATTYNWVATYNYHLTQTSA